MIPLRTLKNAFNNCCKDLISLDMGYTIRCFSIDNEQSNNDIKRNNLSILSSIDKLEIFLFIASIRQIFKRYSFLFQ